MSRPLLILDLDETLIWATEQSLGTSEPPHDLKPDFQVGPYFVYKRPSVDEFLATVASWFDLAVWTSSSAVYAGLIVGQLLPLSADLKFLWSRARCTRRYNYETLEEYWLKDLKKVSRLGYALERIVVVDDSPEKLQRNYGNYVRIRPFEGESTDTELQELLPFLQHLSTLDNVRNVEKRGWRSFGKKSN
jgi:Dullard-like phosphatase family protein